MKSFFKYLLVLLSGFFILFIAIFLIIFSLTSNEPIIEENSYLYIPISGSIPEYIVPSALDNFTGSVSLDLKKIRDILEKAAVDERINGTLINIGFLQMGYAKINELKSYIEKYKESGKKIYAYMDFGLTKEYLLATACDSIFMPESANLFLTGHGVGITFYKGLFEKVGIQADFVHAGEFKDAPDQYTEDIMAPSQRLVLNNILDQFYKNSITIISDKRNISTERVSDLINNTSGFTAKDALKEKFIDAIMYKDEIADLFNFYDSEPNLLSAFTYASVPANSLSIRNESEIAVIFIEGAISGGSDVDDPILGKLAGSKTIIKSIRNAAQLSTVKAIILRINSPGGSAIAADNIWKSIVDASSNKPVIASISDYGASGGYYIAMATDTIINNPMSLVGSIGVFAGKFSTEKLYKKIGLKYERILRGKNATLFSTNSLWSISERAIVQRLINDFYKNFVNKAADSRKMSIEEMYKISEGRVWTGNQAVLNGLADTTGTFYDALKYAKKMAGIDLQESLQLSYYPKEKSFISDFYSLISIKDKLNIFKEIEYTFILKYQNKPLTLMPFILEWN